MSQRIIHCIPSLEKSLAALPHVELGKYADGIVVAVGDDIALSLLDRAPAVSLLFFAREAYDHALRRLSELDRDAAIRKRLEKWAPNAVNEGTDWLYRGERRCLTLTAVTLKGAQRKTVPDNHFEHSLSALHRIVNEGAYGSVTLPGVLVYLIEREALLLVELSLTQAPSETSDRTQFSAAVAQSLRTLGRPEFAQYPAYAEPKRAAFVSPADQELRNSLRVRQRPAVDWQGGLVSTFGARDLDALAERGKKVRVLYPNANQFLQDFTDFTFAQLRREFEERSQAESMPFFKDHLNFLRLETALIRRAANEKAMAENPSVAAVLGPQIPREGALLMAALTTHPSWMNGEHQSQQVSIAQAETELLDDAKFLARLSAAPGREDVHKRYQSFADFKAMQRQRL